MKKWILIFTIVLCVITVTQLSGYSQGFMAEQLDMERFLPVQTLGFDKNGSGIVVSLSTGGEQEGASPMVMTGIAPGIETALTRLQDYSPVNELYYDHIQYIILGESLAKDGVEPVLDWVERSPFMRMDTSVFLVKGSAEEAVTGASGEMGDITERLASLERESTTRGQHIYTLLEAASSLADRNAALCTAVEVVPSEGTVYGGTGSVGLATLPAGYGVLRDGKLIAYLTWNESLGAMFFEQSPVGTVITVEDTALEILHAQASVSGQWAGDGSLAGLTVSCSAKAGILEEDRELSAQDLPGLEEAFAQNVGSCLSAAVARSQQLECDFLALEDGVHREFQARSLSHDQWQSLFAGLPITYEVSAEIQRGYDRFQ